MEDQIINKVANSSLKSIDLEDFYFHGQRLEYDIADNLFQRMILKEKDFREFLKDNNWSIYQDKAINIICSEDAVIPTWAYMLLINKLSSVSSIVIVGSKEQLDQKIWDRIFSNIDFSIYQDQKLVIKGCGKYNVSNYAYAEFTRRLLPFASSIMYGEPCSTVPVYKSK